ncbi:MAG: D-alanyl-D-alanine carboxypeptidase family protein [Thermosynechococcaceae cyanobacterium]
MKVFRDLFEHAQFAAVTLLTAGIVVGLGFIGQHWLGPNERPTATEVRRPSPEAAIDPLDPALEANSSPADFLEAPPPVSPGAPSVALPSPSVALAPVPAPPQDGPKGHLPYQEASPSRLTAVGTFVRGSYQRTEQLDQDAATAFQRMATAAKTEGIQLMPISGFRSIESQRKLFARQIQRQGSEAAAARLSAPPGRSEHHTGYAIDITDAQDPSTDLKLAFQNSGAYRWLVTNGNRYGFELSFPRDNAQGVSFEPWHWRYIGSTNAQSVFKTAKGG